MEISGTDKNFEGSGKYGPGSRLIQIGCSLLGEIKIAQT